MTKDVNEGLEAVIKARYRALPLQRTAAKPQRLPEPEAHKLSYVSLRNGTYKPTQSLWKYYDDPEKQDVLDVMQESLAFGFAKTQGVELPLLLRKTYPDAYLPNPGRCLWTWDTVRKLKGDEPFDLSSLRRVWMRPSRTLSEPLRNVSPRLALHTTQMSMAACHRVMVAVQEQVGSVSPSGYNTVSRCLRTMLYDGLPTVYGSFRDMVPSTPAINSRRNAIQDHALRVPRLRKDGRPFGTYTTDPLPTVLFKHPAFGDDLMPGLLNLAKDAALRAERMLENSKAPESYLSLDDMEAMKAQLQDMETHKLASMFFVMWDWETVLKRLRDRHLPLEERTQALLAHAMLVEMVRRRSRKYLTSLTAQDVLAICRFTGFSPIAFLNYFTSHHHHLGWTPFSVGEAVALADMIAAERPKTPREEALRDELVAEVEQWQVLVPPERHPRFQRAIDFGDLPEWGYIDESAAEEEEEDAAPSDMDDEDDD